MSGHKLSVYRFEKINIIHVLSSSEISNRKKAGKFTNFLKFKDKLLNNQWIKEEITRKIRKYLEMNENGKKTQHTKIRDAAKAVLRGKIYSCTHLH